MTGFQIVDHSDARSQAPTGDIAQVVMGLESLCEQEIELELPHFFPETADVLTVSEDFDTLLSLGFDV